MTKQLSKLGAAFDRQSWQWVQDEDADIAAALQDEVEAGASPDDVRRFILGTIGGDRTGMAARCASAARYLLSVKQRA